MKNIKFGTLKLTLFLNRFGFAKSFTDKKILNSLNDFPNSLSVKKMVFSALKDSNPLLALEVGLDVVSQQLDPTFVRVLAKRLKFHNREKEAHNLLLEIKGMPNKKPHFDDLNSVANNMAKQKKLGQLVKWFDAIQNVNIHNEISFSKKVFTLFKDIDFVEAERFGYKYLLSNPTDEAFFNVYIKRVKNQLTYDYYQKVIVDLYSVSNSNLYKNILDGDKYLSGAKENKSQLVDWVYREAEINSNNKSLILKVAFDESTLNNDFAQSFKLAGLLEGEELNSVWIRKLADFYMSRGCINKAFNYLKCVNIQDELIERKRQSVSTYKNFYDEGIVLEQLKIDGYQPGEKVFYMLHNSLPYNSGGYATRAHGLISGVINNWDVDCVMRYGFPQDRPGLKDKPYAPVFKIDEITYRCMESKQGGYGELVIDDYLNTYKSSLLELCEKERPQILHAASNYMNGVVANSLAKDLGIKSVYEIRGLWEITRISRDPEWRDSEYFKMMASLEAQAANEADAVFTLTEALKNEMIQRGVTAEKITILPNGVDTTRFYPRPKSNYLVDKLGLSDEVIIGFVGSVVQYEGLEYLIHAASYLKGKTKKVFKLIVVGDGDVWESIKQLANELSLSNDVVFTGRVPHDSVEDYYSLIDICPFPRKGLPVCEMVSPLKPFEAMAMGKAVVSSDVAALAEIVQDGKTGLLHKKDDAEDLADKLQLLIENPELREQYGQAAREWVVAERDWKVIAKRVDAVYKKLIGNDIDEKVA